MTRLEHVNLTVSDPKGFAKVMCGLFDWHVRWQGKAINDGFTVHVGSDTDFLALYGPPGTTPVAGGTSYETTGGLNHIGVVVDDLDASEVRIKAAGYVPYSHAKYEPGRRFYFSGPEGVEIEVVSYG